MLNKLIMIIKNSLKDDIYLIKVSKERYLVYSPLRRRLFSVDKIAADYVRKFINGEDFVLIDEKLKTLYNHLLTLNELIPESPIDNREQYGRILTVILSQICNMSCTYCYATAAHSNKVLSIEKFKTFINWCYENGRDEIEKIVFIGGGEPMVTWCLLKESILYLKKKYINTSCSIITNASLIDAEKCDFFSEHNIHIVVSYDILPKVQNIQRPIKDKNSHQIVDKNINLLNSRGVYIAGFRSTITLINVDKMKDMVEYALKHYPFVKSINLEPVTDNNIPRVFYKKFIKNFMLAYELGKKNNVNVYCSFSMSLGTLKYHFCQRELCLTPSGDIVSCHRNSSNADTYFDYFKIGKVTNTVSLADYNQMLLKKEKPISCKTCFAKWHCAGGCVATRLRLSNFENTERCKFIKQLLTKILFDEILK